MWMRGALQLRTPAIGFLHLWDLTVHDWEWDMDWIPDKAWLPTINIMRQYGIVVESFAVNVIGFLRGGGVVTSANKTAFLADAHHPNSRSVEVAVDLLVHALVRLWVRYLIQDNAPASFSFDDDHFDPLAMIEPLRHPKQRPLDLPSRDLRAACLVSPAPHFAVTNVISLYCRPESVEWVSSLDNHLLPDICLGWSTQLAGKADPRRADRKVQVVPARCVTEEIGGEREPWIGSSREKCITMEISHARLWVSVD